MPLKDRTPRGVLNNLHIKTKRNKKYPVITPPESAGLTFFRAECKIRYKGFAGRRFFAVSRKTFRRVL